MANHPPLLVVDIKPAPGYRVSGTITLPNGVRVTWKTRGNQWKVSSNGSNYMATPQDIGFIKQKAQAYLIRKKVSSNAKTEKTKQEKPSEASESFDDIFFRHMVTGIVILAAILFIVAGIASLFDDGIDFSKGAPDEYIIVPTNKGYRPAPVIDFNN